MAGIQSDTDVTQCDDGDIDDLMVSGQTSLQTPTNEMMEDMLSPCVDKASQGMPGNSSEVSLSQAGESDSVDHLDIVVQVPVSKAHRYRRREPSEATTASEESGGESASSGYHPVRSSAAGRCKNFEGRGRKFAFQAFRSPFLEGNGFNTASPSWKRRSLFSTIQQEARLKGNEFFVESPKRKCPRRQGRTQPSSQAKNHTPTKTTKTKKTRTRIRAKRVQGRGPQPADGPGSPDKTGPGSAQPRKDNLVTESEGPTLEESSVPASPRDPGSDSTHVDDDDNNNNNHMDTGLSPQPDAVTESVRRRAGLSGAKTRAGLSGAKTTRTPYKSKKKRHERVSESIQVTVELAPSVVELAPGVVELAPGVVELAPGVVELVPGVAGLAPGVVGLAPGVVELAPGVAGEHENNVDDDKEHRKTKKRKKEKRRKVTEEEQQHIHISLETASDTPDISQRTSGSAVTTINDNDDRSLGGSVDPSVSADAVFTHEASAPTETIVFKKRKRKKDKVAVSPEDPEINPVAKDHTEDVSAFQRPADPEVAALETDENSQRTSGSTMTAVVDDDADHADKHRARKKKRKRENKRKGTEDENRDTSVDGPALETSHISQPTSGSIVNDNSLDGFADQVEDLWKPRKKSKKKDKGHMTNGVTEGDVVDTVLTHETGAPTETADVVFTKRKRKRDKMPPSPEDRGTHPEAEKTEAEENPFEPPAAQESGERPRKKRKERKTTTETPPCASSEDTPAKGNGAASVLERKRKRGHSFRIADAAENHPELNAPAVDFDSRRGSDKKRDSRVSASDVHAEPVHNGETPAESLEGPGDIVEMTKKKKKKKREREALRASVIEEGNDGDEGVCEGSVQDARSSAETGHDGVQNNMTKKKKKKKHDKVDGESESPMVLEREIPDDIQATVLIRKKNKRKKNPRPPSPQGSPSTKALVESGVTISPKTRRCLPVDDVDATQGGIGASPNDDPTAKKKKKKKEKREKSRSVVVSCDHLPERDISGTTGPLESSLKKKNKREKVKERTDGLEAATGSGAEEAQRWSHESEVTSPDCGRPGSPTQLHDERSSPSRVKKNKPKKRKTLFSQQQGIYLHDVILT
ncbi:hypothetical protein NHX12_009813 [Muraenolepis orangiensis]|uniref:Uncharacterized protein n=1 Tax=Muraenolepis orangiensis TaxID=630683 RepID=A0A9Q0DJX8_9TELE|nr:hypothetical protein NHX12_009813 [Muraenolepis orangiensis]